MNKKQLNACLTFEEWKSLPSDQRIQYQNTMSYEQVNKMSQDLARCDYCRQSVMVQYMHICTECSAVLHAGCYNAHFKAHHKGV